MRSQVTLRRPATSGVDANLIFASLILGLMACSDDSGVGPYRIPAPSANLYSDPPDFTSNHSGPIVFALQPGMGFERDPGLVLSHLSDTIVLVDGDGVRLPITAAVVDARLEVRPATSWGNGWHELAIGPLPADIQPTNFSALDVGGTATWHFRPDRNPTLKFVQACRRDDGEASVLLRVSEAVDANRRAPLLESVRMNDVGCSINGAGVVDSLLFHCPGSPHFTVSILLQDEAFATPSDVPRLLNGEPIRLTLKQYDAEHSSGDCYIWPMLAQD